MPIPLIKVYQFTSFFWLVGALLLSQNTVSAQNSMGEFSNGSALEWPLRLDDLDGPTIRDYRQRSFRPPLLFVLILLLALMRVILPLLPSVDY